MDAQNIGRVVLVGGGPGAEDLLTLRGAAEIGRADVILYDRLAPDVRSLVSPTCELIDVGKVPRGEFTPQERINQLLIDHARAGAHVVRLKGGDNYVFGRGGEEALACMEAGVPFRVVPGITSAMSAATAAGVPLTHRGLTQGFTVVSGHVPPGDPRSDLDWTALANSGTTLAILMGVKNLPEICSALIDGGMDPATPAVTVEQASTPAQRVLRGTVSTIAEQCADAGVAPPATTVIGKVAALDLTSD